MIIKKFFKNTIVNHKPLPLPWREGMEGRGKNCFPPTLSLPLQGGGK
jgi:hypothetical protein